MRIFLGTMPRAMNWGGLRAGKDRRASSQRSSPCETGYLPCSNRGALSAPIAAQAQTEITTGVVRGGSVIIDDDIDGIAVDRRPAFREYVVRERVPNYAIQDRVIVGGVLPEAGITYYDVPQTYGPTPYRYTVGERPDRAGRAALPPHRSGGRVGLTRNGTRLCPDATPPQSDRT